MYVATWRTEVYLTKSYLLKNWHYLDLICSVKVVSITTVLSCSNRSVLKKWHFLDLVCSVLVIIKTGFSYGKQGLPKMWNFLDLICAIYVVTMQIEVYFVKYPLLKKLYYLDLICSL